jgi:predicted dehydrogenase
MSAPTQYAIVGTGGRCSTFVEAICGAHRDVARIVSLCDISPTRMNYWNDQIARHYGHKVAAYHADDFSLMIRERKPDVLIVTTIDSEHHAYIIRAMELGCDVITEKPMTTDEIKAAAILRAVETTGQTLRVAFNYRYMPVVAQIKRLLAEGEVGTPTSVDFQWYLDTRHGADYFRRWHREMDKSGGLLVHKSTHHFDMVNFLVGSYADTVFAMGDLKFYGRANAEARGEHYSYTRYTGHVTPAEDPFAIDISRNPLYIPAERESGYVRDRNVFGDDPPIDICDTHAVMARYRNGVILNYSMFAYCPWEGERLTINGTKGQIEYFSQRRGHIIQGQSDAELAEAQQPKYSHLRVQQMFRPARMIELPKVPGGHDGADPLMHERLFRPDVAPDPVGRDANHIDGAASILIGVAANRSIQHGQPVRVDDLLQIPDPIMPAGTGLSGIPHGIKI